MSHVCHRKIGIDVMCETSVNKVRYWYGLSSAQGGLVGRGSYFQHNAGKLHMSVLTQR